MILLLAFFFGLNSPLSRKHRRKKNGNLPILRVHTTVNISYFQFNTTTTTITTVTAVAVAATTTNTTTNTFAVGIIIIYRYLRCLTIYYVLCVSVYVCAPFTINLKFHTKHTHTHTGSLKYKKVILPPHPFVVTSLAKISRLKSFATDVLCCKNV